MKRYKCRICDMEFDQPYFSTEYNHMPDGFTEKRRMAHCPICGEGHFDEIWDDAEENY